MPYQPAQMQSSIHAQQPHNFFPPQTVSKMPQYTNLDIPQHIDENLKKMQESLAKLKEDNKAMRLNINKKKATK